MWKVRTNPQPCGRQESTVNYDFTSRSLTFMIDNPALNKVKKCFFTEEAIFLITSKMKTKDPFSKDSFIAFGELYATELLGLVVGIY